MSSTIEFNGKKYDKLTGRVLSSSQQPLNDIDEKKVLETELNIISKPKENKIEVKTETEINDDLKKPVQKHKAAVSRQTADRRHRVEKPKTLMRTAVKKTKYKPAAEHNPPPRAGLHHEQARERVRRVKHIQRSSAVTKFSKSAPKRRSDTTFVSKPLPVVDQPPSVQPEENNLTTQVEQFTGTLEAAVHSAQSHMEEYTGKKFRSGRSRTFAYALASFTSVFLIGFAIYQAVPYVQVKLASDKAGFSATLPGYAPNGYGLQNNLKSDRGVVTMTYGSESENKDYEIIQTPSKWNSDSLLNNYVLPYSNDYERIDQNGQTVYLYNSKNSATWLDNGIWYRLDGANNFSNDQLVRIVQGL
ncbi:MAG TPA: hypothetical protein VFX79_01075 [Candidatus Saccharimonadales bacterium]|nr:hypothetical protein [Candidatus Saccharimonadales bacterium]